MNIPTPRLVEPAAQRRSWLYFYVVGVCVTYLSSSGCQLLRLCIHTPPLFLPHARRLSLLACASIFYTLISTITKCCPFPRACTEFVADPARPPICFYPREWIVYFEEIVLQHKFRTQYLRSLRTVVNCDNNLFSRCVYWIRQFSWKQNFLGQYHFDLKDKRRKSM